MSNTDDAAAYGFDPESDEEFGTAGYEPDPGTDAEDEETTWDDDDEVTNSWDDPAQRR